MTLRTIWRVIARWKWIVIPGLVLALGAGGALFLRTPKTYTVEASYLFLSPVKDTKGVASNPFLQLGNGVAQAVDVLAVSLTDGQTVRSFTAHEPKLTYTAARDLSVAAPLMVISVEDVDRKAAASTLASLGTILGERLNSMQQNAGAPQNQWITMSELTNDPKPTIGYADAIRNGVLGFGAVMLVVFIVVAIAERIRVRVEARRERRAENGTEKHRKSRKKRRTPPPEEASVVVDPPDEPLRELLEPERASAEEPGPEPVAEPRGRASRAQRRPGTPPSDHDADDLEDVLADDPMSQLRS